jgi:hypothetical protein
MKIAFKNDSGLYYAFKSDLSGLKIVSAYDYTSWNDDSILESLTPDNYRLLYGMELVVYSGYEDDTFTSEFNTYDVITTSDNTAFQLKGYCNINQITATATSGCKFLISFDNRKTWLSYNTASSSWTTVLNAESNIYSKGMTTEEINALTSTIIKQVYKRTQLDFMIAITSDDSFTNITLTLPPNNAPVISNLVLSNTETHKDDVNVSCDITDIDGDDITYNAYFNGGTDSITSGFIEGESFIDSHNITFMLNFKDFKIGTNKVDVVMTDSKGASNTKTFYVTRKNETPVITGILNNNIYTALIDDADGDNIKYRVLLNDEEVKEWSDFEPVPLSFSYEIPRDKIKFGVINYLVIEYVDDGDEDTVNKLSEEFVGSYYGLLFTDNTGSFYSDSLGNAVKKYIVSNIIASKQTKTYSAIIYNKSNNNLKDVIIDTPFIHSDIKLELSYSDTPFVNEEKLVFSDLLINEKKEFYFRISTNSENTLGDFNILVNGIGNIAEN